MNIIKYDPFRELRNLQDEMNRLFIGTAPRGREEMARRLVEPECGHL